MQSLLLAPHLFSKIDDGSKRATIRYGKRDIVLGELMLISSEDENVSKCVRVTEVYEILWQDLGPKEADLDGYDNADHLRRELRRFYPQAQDDDMMTIIRYDI